MRDNKKDMIKALDKIFVPHLRRLDFKGSFPNFRKTDGDFTSLLTFQFDKNSGGFIIELAIYRGNEFKTDWGKIIFLNELTAHDIDFEKRVRIFPSQSKMSNGVESWFRYDKISMWPFGNKFEKIAKNVVEKIPLMEKIWIG